ncbi:NUDIX hydrolase [Saccharopolyspora phatthalungensis]|uniref:8-oxo-dGTP pyrophosphatase MutT (NUDIX family) n=1 Tax=Saccharopolyspora phatthalungensis TaxID=664693 RepID=A0A840QID9_9PSEU|nr:NUDIX domain-containing protein [Saccharopolyspora phatthalungensis]MBB5160061.1 8-oxo-dGTP pyrophosphatase MutT (NUDIX family) [Saccharopolyspora phatthalungensis]
MWELAGGYVDPNEETALTAAREVEEETGWRPLSIRPFGTFQPVTGSADFENLLFLADGAEDTGKPADINETARVEWMPSTEIPERIDPGEIPGAARVVAKRLRLTASPTLEDLCVLLPEDIPGPDEIVGT